MNEKKTRIVDLSYHFNTGETDYSKLIQQRASSYGHFKYLNDSTELTVLRLMEAESKASFENVNYYLMKGKNSKLWLPFRLHRFINSLNPHVILVHGFDYPIQVLFLKLQTKGKIIIQYHGGGQPSKLKGMLQKVVKLFVKHYVFTAKEQADGFINSGLISRQSTVHEILEGSTHKTGIEKKEARRNLKIDEKATMFLWVGRLIENKDPLTVLKGLSDFLCNYNAILVFIYQDKTLLTEIQNFLANNETLKQRVKLIGELSHEKLDVYYSAANFYVSGSYYEGSGYSLFEAMACGCVPLVTDIPSFRKMTCNGTIGALWSPGNVSSLQQALAGVLAKNYAEESNKAKDFFECELSFKAIANKYLEMAMEVSGNKRT